MGLDRNFISREYKSIVNLSIEDISSYLSAIGANQNVVSDIVAPPCFSVSYELPLIYKILEDPKLHGSLEQYRKNMLMMVHGDQLMKFYNPIKPDDQITCYAKIDSIEDKGTAELLTINVTSSNQDNKKVVESKWGLFVRGIGSGKRPQRRIKTSKPVLDTKSIIFNEEIKVPFDITNKYSMASNDMNPIHLDQEVAKRAGFPGIVVHGMCTMATAAQKLIKGCLNNNSNNLISLGVRFSAPVFPGDVLQIEASKTLKETKFAFQVVRKSDETRVIRDGLIEIRE